MEEKFKIGQRVRVNDKMYPNENDCNGILGTVKGIDFCDINDLYYCVALDEIPQTRNFKGKLIMYFNSRVLEAIEDEPIEKEVEHIIEEQDKQDEMKVLEECFENNGLSKNEFITLKLIKYWSGQIGKNADFSTVFNYYKSTLKELDEAQNQAIDGEKKQSREKIRAREETSHRGQI